PAPAEQGRRITVFGGAYGVATTPAIVDAIEEAVRSSVERLHSAGRSSDAEWWSAQLDWLLRGSGVELRAALTPPDLSRDRRGRVRSRLRGWRGRGSR